VGGRQHGRNWSAFFPRHPDVVLRLFSEALSLDGRFKAMESRFWNKLEFVTTAELHQQAAHVHEVGQLHAKQAHLSGS
jgi:hypothetical protein